MGLSYSFPCHSSINEINVQTKRMCRKFSKHQSFIIIFAWGIMAVIVGGSYARSNYVKIALIFPMLQLFTWLRPHTILCAVTYHSMKKAGIVTVNTAIKLALLTLGHYNYHDDDHHRYHYHQSYEDDNNVLGSGYSYMMERNFLWVVCLFWLFTLARFGLLFVISNN